MHPRGQDARPLDDSDGKANEVELTRLHDVVLGHLATDQRTSGGATAMRDAGHDVRHDLLDQLAGRDVVEEEERLGALYGDVVDGARDEVDADRVVLSHQTRDERLRAHPVGGRDEDRLAHAAGLVGEEPAEASDVTHDLRAERRPNVLFDALDRALARGDVDARSRVREWLRRAFLVGSHLFPLSALMS